MTTETPPALTPDQPKPVTPATAPPTSSEASDILQQLAGIGVTPGDTDRATLEQHLVPDDGPKIEVIQGSADEASGGLETSIVTGAETTGLQSGFPVPMVSTTESEDGRIHIYNKFTGEQIKCNVNMLPSKLKNRVNDNTDPNYGKLLWTVVDPGFRPKQGTFKCWLHMNGAWRELADSWGRPYCRKSNIKSEFDVIQHVKNTHKRDYLAIDEHRKEGERKEDRKIAQATLSAMTAIAAGREVEVPVATVADGQVTSAPVATEEVSEDKGPTSAETPFTDYRGEIVTDFKEPAETIDIWKDAHKTKERPRPCPIDICDWTTRSKSNKIAKQGFDRHRAKVHSETLNT